MMGGGLSSHTNRHQTARYGAAVHVFIGVLSQTSHVLVLVVTKKKKMRKLSSHSVREKTKGGRWGPQK